MARRNRRFRRDPDDKKPSEAHNTPAATFPPPTEGAADKLTFGDKLPVTLSRVERLITRYALNYYVVNLKKRAKTLGELGLSTDEIVRRIAIINGGNGLGSGIYDRLTEQPSIGDEAQLVLDDERRALEAECTACRDVVIKLSEMPVGEYGEQLLNHIRTWAPGQRTAAIAYATAVNALPEGETYAGERPSVIKTAIDRALEWTMSEDEVEYFVKAGPWKTAWLEDDIKKAFWYAERPSAVEGEPATRGDEGLFETEPEARRCVARLNRMAALDKQTGEGGAPEKGPDEKAA